VIVILSGLLPRPEMTMSMMGITFNVHALCFFAAHGLSGAASTRVGNELGAAAGACSTATAWMPAALGCLHVHTMPPSFGACGCPLPLGAWMTTALGCLHVHTMPPCLGA